MGVHQRGRMSAFTRFKVSQSREGAQGTSTSARLRLGLTMLSAHLHHLRLVLLSALAITFYLPTLLAASGVHLSWQPTVLRLTCAFLRKTGQLPRL
ncbi:hypothetical protein E2C01_088091 [Portunus trituberculatus]|uniref:Uncharacterized protein n=1 Tax=Portunus trituberculatus TaxID=210409 RepID=A0A5B7JFR5_PORTR|nr:hypothetical protein [Portunus trituberculatus]